MVFHALWYIENTKEIGEETMKENLEIETKYRALCTLTQFKHVCEMFQPDEYIKTPGGKDYFYSTSKRYLDYSSFFRYRESSTGEYAELTYKKKTIEHDSVIRIEDNLRLKGPIKDKGENFCNSMGYTFNASIWKQADIYEYKDCTLSYYIVRGPSGIVDTFIEIELKNPEKFATKEDAMNELSRIEHLFCELEIKKELRLQKSLFEMYRR